MRKITVTENNFEKVLVKLQKRCDKYKMLEFYRVLNDKTHKRNSIGFRKHYIRHIDAYGNCTFKTKKKFFKYTRYICAMKHHIREAYETDKESYDARHIYPELKPLIYLELSGSGALVIGEGDIVQFLPFGGFIVWTDDEYTRFDNPLTIYKHIYIPDFIKGKIKNLEQEKEIRKKECEEYDKRHNKVFEPEMDEEMNEYMMEECEKF